MKKCCCCIPILEGATVIGFITLALCALKLVLTIPYLAGIDVETFNPIQNNLQYMYDQIEYATKNVSRDADLTKSIVPNVEENTWEIILSDTVSTVVYFIVSLMMICGIRCKMRGLMLPYMVVQMLYIILGIVTAVGVTVILFYYNLIMGIVAAASVLIPSFLIIYFWVTVKKAYFQLGNGDSPEHSYSPVTLIT
jgi:hypothetical protein